MRLPEALAPWAVELALFPRDLALSMGPVLRRLGAVVGPFPHALHAGAGEVDGFDGLAHRGSYERLLMSEWLLAEEAPAEFDRRAATGEHSFLRLARPEAVGSRRSVALFDAGPAQIGSPRIVHLAALVLLARRAATAGAAFGWGVVQNRERTLHEELTPSSVKHLLEGRTAETATDSDLAGWWERLGSPQADDDVWLVGGQALVNKRRAQEASSIEVWDALTVDARRVGAAIRKRTGRRVDVDLELPGETESVRLLRDPFAVRAPVPVKAPPGHARMSRAVFTTDGFRLIARARTGGILEYSVPSSPRQSVGGPKLRRLATRGFPLAAGRAGDCLIVVTATSRGFELHYLLAADAEVPVGSPPSPPGYAPPRDRGSLEACHVLRAVRNGMDLVFCDGHGALVRLSEGEAGRSSRVLATRVVAWAPSEDGVVWVERRSPGESVAVRLRGEERTELALAGEGAAFFGFGGGFAHPAVGLLAVEVSPQTFSVRNARGSSRIRVPADCQVLGVGLNPRRREVGLLVRDVDGRSLVQVGQSWTRRLPRESSAIEYVAFSPAASDLAYVTRAGDLVLYSLEQEDVLRRYVPAEGWPEASR